jgi:hypothetical protein
MNMLEFIVSRVCTEYEKNINVLEYVSPSDENQDLRALTVLQLIADQGESIVEPKAILPILKRVNLTFRRKCSKALTISEVRVHHLPFYLATQILLRKDRRIDRYPFVPFVNHKSSDIRAQSYYCLWLSKKCLVETGILPLLLDNIAKSLFYNDAALGIALRICVNRPELIEFVKNYERA